MRRPLAIVGLLFLACGPSQATAVASPSPSVISTPGAGPSAIPDLPVTAAGFSCRLPVVTSTGASPAMTLQGGFITFPAAKVVEDTAGTMYSRIDEGDFATTAAPVLAGDGVVPFYDQARSRWVPARASQTLADGSGYAYVTRNQQTGVFTAHVTDVASGSSQAFTLTSPSDPEVADYGPAGVYIVSASGLGGPGEGVWLLDPKTGAIKQLGQIHRVWAVRDGYAWVARLDPRDQTAWPPSELAPANSLVRIDLATGAETIWFYKAGSYPWLLGLDSNDRPVVLLGVSPEGNEIRLIDQPGSSGVLVYSGDTSELDYVQGDGDRLWFGSARGIYVYSPNAGFQKVFAYDANPASSDRIEPSGFCR
jgi:hypothetical protein